MTLHASSTSADDLGLQALATPAIGAADALEVLLDALLEAETWTDHASAGADALRRRAYAWAKQRHTTAPSPTELVAAVVVPLLDGLPHAVVGIVRPFVVRVHFLAALDAVAREAVRRSLDGCLPAAVAFEVTAADA